MPDSIKSSIQGGRRLAQTPRHERALVSIVAVVFRARRELLALLESVAPMFGPSLEVIVIDGGSQDGTIELLQDWNDRVDYWISEPDAGIYDAMNKGVAVATGDYVLHLNAGDRLRHLPFDELKQCKADNIDAACFAVDMAGFGIHRPRTGFLLRFSNSWHHQGTFYHRADHLGYNPLYRVFGDFDLNQRMVKSGKSVRLFDVVVAEQAVVGVSANQATYQEQYALIRTNFGLPYVWLARIWRRIFPVVAWMKRRSENESQSPQ